MRRVSRGALLLWSVAVVAAVGAFTVLLAFAGDRVRPAEAPQDAWQRISLRVERPIRGRLSSSLRYRPCPEAAAICGPLPSPSSPEFVDASMLLARLAQETALDAGSLHAEALVRLTLRGARSAEILPRLEAAAALAPSDSRIAADLLAVRLAHAEEGLSADPSGSGVSGQVLRAVAEAVRLATVHADEPAVWFNYALVFETVGLPRTAAEGWRRFLALEPDGLWADEVRQRLAAAEVAPAEVSDPPIDAEELVAWAEEHPLEARSHLERNLLAAWVAEPEGPAGSRALHLAQRLAAITARRFHDSTIADTFEVLRTAPPDQRRRLVMAFRRYFDGLQGFGERRFTDALAAFGEARAGMGDIPFLGWADYRVATTLYSLDRYVEARELLRAMRRDPDRQQVLETRRLWLLGLVENRLGGVHDLVALSEQALAVLVRHGDLPAIASMHANLAPPLDQLGQPDRAWAHRLESLRASARLSDRRLRHVALHGIVTRLIEMGEPEAALPFLAELQSNAAAWDAVASDPLARLEVVLLHVSALSTAGRHAQAAEQLTVATGVAGELSDPDRLERLNADIAVERAEVLLAQEPARALEELDRATEIYRRFDYRHPLVRVHRLRGVAAERLGMSAAAGEAYRRAVATHEEVLTRLEEPDHRAGYLAHASDAYAALLRHLAAEVGGGDEAFDVLERSRRVWSASAAAETHVLRDLQARLPESSALVAYRVLADETLVWWVTPGERDLLVMPGGRAVVDREVTRHEVEMALATTQPGAGSATATLHERLLGPLAGRLDGIRRLAIVPDRLLNRVAFAAVLEAGPSAPRLDTLDALHILPAVRRSVDRGPIQAGGLVTVGDPAFDRSAFPSLELLPAAALEAREVAALYPGSVALLGKEAQPSRIHQELRGRRALHYAGHALYDPLAPERSGLLLAPERGDDGLLSISEIEELSLRGLELVVLSACRTSAGNRSASQDWAEALLDAGVRGVIANRWEIEDEAARRFVLRFHRHRVAGIGDAEALLAAQRELRGEAPRVWAGFSYYGEPD